MQIHHLINDSVATTGGAERIARTLVESQKAQGKFEVCLVGVSSARFLGVDGGQTKSPYSGTALLFVLRYIRDHVLPDDVVHAHLFPTFLYVALARWLLRSRARFVYTEHNTWNRRRAIKLWRMVDLFCYSQFDCICAISNGVRQSLIDWLPSLGPKIRVVPNGVKLPKNRFEPRDQSDTLIVLSAGSLTPQKNFERAIRACALLTDCDLEYWIAGAGEQRGELERAIAELSLGDRVRLLGFVENLDPIYAQASIFLIPSLWEGFGLVAVEAMNHGLPIVCSDVPGLNEVVARDGTRFVDAGSEESIASAVRFYIESPEERVDAGHRNFERSLAFDHLEMCRRYDEVYAGCWKGAA